LGTFQGFRRVNNGTKVAITGDISLTKGTLIIN
jgi:hypothetical protein